LPWAVGATGCGRKYFKELKEGRLVIFWNENLMIPSYHYYDVEIDNPLENAKMWKDGGRSLVNQIAKVAELRGSGTL
ncbi:MAG: hypothetical protein IKX05_01190, partial [Bacteroidales bacterium]|nr:hypothetical protein [Bacteroidales bacterium]